MHDLRVSKVLYVMDFNYPLRKNLSLSMSLFRVSRLHERCSDLKLPRVFIRVLSPLGTGGVALVSLGFARFSYDLL